MRGRQWRRYQEEIKVIRRLKDYRIKFYYYSNIGVNRWIYLIDQPVAHKFKTKSERSYGIMIRGRWGKKPKKYRSSSDPFTRHKDKLFFKKELDRIGFKHLPTYTRYESELEGSEF